LRGDLLWFENQYVEFEFPKNLFAYPPLEYVNSTYGSIFNALFFDYNSSLVIGLTIQDETATRTYFQVYNLTDVRSAIFMEINITYQEILKECISRGYNATFSYLENGTMDVSSQHYKADYSIYIIKIDYLQDSTLMSNSRKYIYISYMNMQRLVQITLAVNEEYYNESRQIFDSFLTSMRVKT